MKYRKEFDSIGVINVPNDKYWGASTQRSSKYFDIGDFLVRPIVIKSIAIIKKAAAIINEKNGDIEKKIKNAIVKASNEVISGKLDGNFPLKVWQTGSGTQTNMNVNEVIANRAIEILGGRKGTKKPVHPNDHVNKSQSTNDVFPTAMHMSIAIWTKDKLIPSLNMLNMQLKKKEKEFKKIVKIGRTHLQDATPITLGQEFSGYHSQLTKCIERIKKALEEIYLLAQGGTAVGTGINCPSNFTEEAIKIINKETQYNFKQSENKFSLMASHDRLANLMSQLKNLAGSLFKISNDIKILSSGPRSGIYELIIPQNEPGSSIMPGKINPTQCEALSMICTQVMGLEYAVSIANCSGTLQMNEFKPLIGYNILKSIKLLSDAINNFKNKLVIGMKPNLKSIKNNLDNSLMLVTALVPEIGYEKAAEIANLAFKESINLKQATLKLGYLNEKRFHEIIKIDNMI